jgi:hypothetical protein
MKRKVLFALFLALATPALLSPAMAEDLRTLDGKPATLTRPVLACPDSYPKCFEAFDDIGRYQRLDMKKELQEVLQSSGTRRISAKDGPFIRVNRGIFGLCRIIRVADYTKDGPSIPEKELWINCEYLRKK